MSLHLNSYLLNLNFHLFLVLQASRAQILKQATDYIQFMTKKSNTIQHDIDDLKKQNTVLEQQSKDYFILILIAFFSGILISTTWLSACSQSPGKGQVNQQLCQPIFIATQ